MHDIGRRNRHLRYAISNDRFEKSKIVGDDPTFALQRALRIRRRRDADNLALGSKSELPVTQFKTLNGVDETRRPTSAPKLSVGYARKTERFLECYNLADAVICNLGQARVIQFPCFVRANSVEQLSRANEASDMLRVN